MLSFQHSTSRTTELEQVEVMATIVMTFQVKSMAQKAAASTQTFHSQWRPRSTAMMMVSSVLFEWYYHSSFLVEIPAT